MDIREKIYVGVSELIEREPTESGYQSFLKDSKPLVEHAKALAEQGIVDKEELETRLKGDVWYLQGIPNG